MAYLRKGAPVPTNGKGRKLSPKMRQFVAEYLVDGNATQAVLRAGYKTKNPSLLATELKNHPLVAEAIEAGQAKKEARNEVTADYVLEKLIQMLEANEKANPNAAIRCAELLGKHLALFRERQEISGPDGGAIEMEQRTRENAEDFTSKLSRLASGGGEAGVVSFPKRSGEG